METSSVKNISKFGQSIWLDFFDRDIMDSGKLEGLIEEGEISGLTSNPSVFETAISTSDDYAEDIKAYAKQGLGKERIFLRLAVKDIQWAADLFKDLHNSTRGQDGFVSMEVSPNLANDTLGTIKQARVLWKAINRKNVMIKIPATTEGLAAIRACTSEGININVTLLFSLERYKEVIDAYFAGLEDRLRINLSINQITSVASFFLSRIDSAVNPLLEERGLIHLKGEVAIASAKKAYAIYKEAFTSERFKQLQLKGARRQRLLWASTSSKDPSMSDIKYVEALIGPETINTVPLVTLKAFRDHGKPGNRLEDNLDYAYSILAQLGDKGINLNSIAYRLEKEGISKFNMAYDRLLEAIEMQQAKTPFREVKS